MASSSTTPQIYNQQTTDRWELSIPITTKNFEITKQWIIIQYIDIVRGNHWLRIHVGHSSWKESRAEMPLIKFIGAANRQSPLIARKFLPLCHRNTRLACVLKNAMIYCADEQGVQLKLMPSVDWGNLCCIIRGWSTHTWSAPHTCNIVGWILYSVGSNTSRLLARHWKLAIKKACFPIKS